MLRLQLSDDCYLRLLEEADAQELFELVDANRAYLRRWLPWVDSAEDADYVLAFIRLTRRQLADNNGIHAAIVEGGRIIGVVGFHSIDWANRSTSIGYWLAEAYQGRGLMTLAVKALIDHAFDVWKLNRVEIRVAVENPRSRAIPERLGFQEEGTLRQAERHGDRYKDIVVYATLERDPRPPPAT